MGRGDFAIGNLDHHRSDITGFLLASGGAWDTRQGPGSFVLRKSLGTSFWRFRSGSSRKGVERPKA